MPEPARRTVEIDESELLTLKGVNDVVTAMLNHPTAGPLVRQARKLQDPNARVAPHPMEPATEAVNAVRAEFAAFKKEQEDAAAARKAEAATAQFQADWNAAKDRLRQAGWRAEGIAEIEKHAHDRGIPDLEVAAAHYEKLHPPTAPVTPSGYGSWDFFAPAEGEKETYVDKLMSSRGEDDGALRQETHRALQEYRAQMGALRR